MSCDQTWSEMVSLILDGHGDKAYLKYRQATRRRDELETVLQHAEEVVRGATVDNSSKNFLLREELMHKLARALAVADEYRRRRPGNEQ
jgi:hypothetical protein